MRDNSGFTLIELIMTMLLISILAVYAAPKLDIFLFRNTNFFLQATSSIRYAQKQAIATGCNVEVNINASGCNLVWSNPGDADTNCPNDDVAINSPSNGTADFCQNSTPAAAPTLTPDPNMDGTFIFDNIGRPSPNNQYDLDTGTQTIRVEAETGYTHEN